MKIYPYKQGSKSARLLADALDCKILRREGNPIRLGGQAVINWGSSKINRELITLKKPKEKVLLEYEKNKYFKYIKIHIERVTKGA